MPPSISVLQPSHSRHQVSFAPRASYGVSNCYCRYSPTPSARLFEEFFNIHGLFPTSNGSHKELRLLQQFRCYRWCNFCTTDRNQLPAADVIISCAFHVRICEIERIQYRGIRIRNCPSPDENYICARVIECVLQV